MKASNALKGTRDESSSDKSESQDDDDEVDVGLIAKGPFKGKKKFSKENRNRDRFIGKKKLRLLLVSNATNRTIEEGLTIAQREEQDDEKECYVCWLGGIRTK